MFNKASFFQNFIDLFQSNYLINFFKKFILI